MWCVAFCFLFFLKYECFGWFFSDQLLSVLRGHSFFSSPPQRPMTSDFEGFSIPDFIDYIYFPILILEKEPVFLILMLSAKQGNYLVPFLSPLWYDAVLNWGLNLGPPAFEKKDFNTWWKSISFIWPKSLINRWWDM